jgi:predicted transcriptional regulator
MKTLLLLPLLLLTFAVSAQKTKKYKNIITNQKKVIDVTGSFYEIESLDSLNCDILDYAIRGYKIYLPIVDPESEQHVKDSAIVVMEARIQWLIDNKVCVGEDLCLKIIDGIMLTKEEVAHYYETNYDRMIEENVSRFAAKYGKQLSETFPERKIYIENYNW